jgi:DNA-binding SARP family transcriptional activator/TolB-like protein
MKEERAKVVRLDTRRVEEIGQRVEAPGQQTRKPILRIHVLGSMRATTFLGDNVLPRGKKARAILGFLCIAAGRPVTRARLAAMLWDRVRDSQARTSFRQALRELSASFGAFANEVILGDRDSVRIDSDLCWIDALAVLSPEPSPLNRLRSDLAALCSGELLEELDGASTTFDQWLLAERTRFSGQLRALLEDELKAVDRSQVDATQRAAVAQRLIAYDATHERASRVLMRALADLGDRAQAVREYQRCRAALKGTLDVEPSPETQTLYAHIRSQTARRDTDSGTDTSPASNGSRLTGRAPARSRLRVGVLSFHAPGVLVDRNLAASLSQEIAAALARFRWFDVIAPSVSASGRSALARGRARLRQKDLDYVVDGNLRKTGAKLQISVRLLDLAQDAQPVWSDRFELAVGQLHLLDELVTARIVGRVDPVILFIEGQPRRRERYGATGLLLRAIPLMFSMQEEKFHEAGDLISQALEMDPEDAMAAAWAAHWQVFYVGQGWASDTAQALATAQQHALRAIRLDPDNAEALGIYAHVCAFLDKDFDSALYYFDRSLRLNPNLGYVWALRAVTYCYIGMPDIALTQMERYHDLAPFDPYFSFFEGVSALAYLLKRDYERAASVGRRMVKAHPGFINSYKTLISALGYLGRSADAKPYIDKLMTLEPGFCIERFAKVYPLKKPADRDLYMKGLRLAGAPETRSDLSR